MAKKSRTAVKTLRTGLESEQKEVKRRVKKHIVDVIDAEYVTLVSDVKIQEGLRQDEVTAYEFKKEAEKLEKARIEQARIDNIKKELDDYVAKWKSAFNAMAFDTIEEVGSIFLESYTGYDLTVLEEFDALFPSKVEELTQYLSERTVSLTNDEMVRVEKIRIADEAKKLAEQKAEFAAKQKLADEAEAKAKAEREAFEKEKADFAAKQAEAAKQLLEAKSTPAPEAIKVIDAEILVPDLPTVNVCTSLDAEKPKNIVDRMIPLVDAYNTAELKRMQSSPTWKTIQEDFKTSGQKSYSKFLVDNYNAPTKL